MSVNTSSGPPPASSTSSDAVPKVADRAGLAVSSTSPANLTADEVLGASVGKSPN